MAKSYRSAVTGRYVKPEYAAKHPRITVGEKRPKPQAKGAKK